MYYKKIFKTIILHWNQG